ncbi:MAG: hypothetical protein P1U56_20285 [Saprospiraceae bacterium]|nr:hypothetical protein [Saprospiraceae bacterium]
MKLKSLFFLFFISLVGYQTGSAQSGKVGIGTLTPDTTLHIVGALKVEDGYQGAGKVLTSDANGLAIWSNYVELDPKILVDSLNIIPRWDGSSLVNGTIFDNGTNVGIGTTSPSKKLEVAGDIRVNAITIGRGNFDNTSNTVVGLNALKSNVSGLGNTAMGDQALENTDTNFNTGFGYRALWKTTTGKENVAIGSALTLNETGERNVGIGHQTLDNTDANHNTAVGFAAAKFNTDGVGNVAMGYFSMLDNTTGDYNTALGYKSGENNQGSRNVFLGFEAGKDEAGSDKLYIENTSSATPLIYGDFANDTVKVYGTLNINDEFSFPTTDGTSGQILQTDGNGIVSWVDTLSEVDPKILIDSLNILPRWDGSSLVNGTIFDNGTNVGIGTTSPSKKLEVAGDIRVNAITIGRGNFDNTSNTVVGLNALKSNVSGLGNTAMGDQALENTDTNFNTGFGYRALWKTTTGKENVAIGSALTLNETGERNVGIGHQTLDNTDANHNTAVGFAAAKFNTDGVGNVAMGYFSMLDNTTGDYNTALGYKSGENNQGSRNVFLGFEAGKDEAGSDKLYIENTNSAMPLIYGDFANDTVKVYGTLNIGDNYSLPTNDGTNGQILTTDGNGTVNWVDTLAQIASENVNRIPRWDGSKYVDGSFLDDGTNVGIGTNPNSNYTFTLKGNTFFDIDEFEYMDVKTYGAGLRVYTGNDPTQQHAMLRATTGGPFYRADLTLKSPNGNIVIESPRGNDLTDLSGIKASGKIHIEADSVGIGTATPNAKLDVVGDMLVNGLSLGRRGTAFNLVFGFQALENLTTGNYNTAVGRYALRLNTQGVENTGIGDGALQSNTSGSQNTGIGLGALAVNATSSSNTAVGYTALGESTGGGNTAVGAGAMVDLFTGSNNVSLGSGTMPGLNSGSNNTAIGTRSGHNSVGDGNVFLGYEAGYFETGDNKLYIDNSNTTDALIYGDFDTDDVYIHGTMSISETLKLSPLPTAPTCGSSQAGLIYFDDTLKKLRVCDGTAWQNLH